MSVHNLRRNTISADREVECTRILMHTQVVGVTLRHGLSCGWGDI